MTDLKADLFPRLAYPTYLNHAAISPINRRVTEAVNRLMDDYARRGVHAWPEGNAIRDRLREKLARLIQARPTDLALIQNTTHGLSLVANEYPWQKGDRLVLCRSEFPGNIVPWLNAAARFELEVLWLDPSDIILRTQAFSDAMAQGPRLLAISWVQFQSGLTQDLAQLSALRSEFGVHIALDAIQGLGPLRMKLDEHPLDFVICGGHKWLLSPEGTGFLYVHPERIVTMRPSMVGWLSQEDPVSFLFKGSGYVDYEKPVRQETGRYEWATMNSLGYAGMEASIDLYLEVGAETISKTVTDLAGYCRNGLIERGYQPVTEHCHAGITSIPLPSEQLRARFKQLDDAGIVVSTPDGHLRCSAHFYNDRNDIDRYLDVMAQPLPS